jgi:hypothetical protein
MACSRFDVSRKGDKAGGIIQPGEEFTEARRSLLEIGADNELIFRD